MNEERFYNKLLFGLSIITLLFFIYGFLKEINIGHPVLYSLLSAALLFKILKAIFEWYHFIGLRNIKQLYNSTDTHQSYTVDIFTTACPGEPFKMIEETLTAMVNIDYPHQNYLCDEGNDPKLYQLCKKLGVHHVARPTHENAKAGNINYALDQSNGDISVILDPDHVPSPDFLNNILHHFKDPIIGYVQVVQAYKNQYESMVARAAAEQTYLFYGPLMQAMNEYGTVQAIGANCTFRRSALESIGGHAPGLTEDMHTAMLLHAKGWKSVFVPEIVSQGLVPTSLSAFYQQQLKWSRGTFDLWLNLYPRLFKNFTWRQKIHYGFLPIFYLFGFITLIDIGVPIYSLFTGDYPWIIDPLIFFYYAIPFILSSLLYRLYSQKWLYSSEEKGLHVLGGILRSGSWWIYILGFVYTLFNIKVPYLPTPKTHTNKYEFLLALPNLVVAVISIIATIYGLQRDWQPYSFLMAGFALTNGIIFFIAFISSQSILIFALRRMWRNWAANILHVKWQFSYVKLNKQASPIVVSILIIISIILVSSISRNSLKDLYNKNKSPLYSEQSKGIYTGIYLPTVDESLSLDPVFHTEELSQHQWSIISTYLSWNNPSMPISLWNNIIEHGSIPMITWEPFIEGLPHLDNHPELRTNRKLFFHISEGYFDDYIDQVAVSIRNLDAPVFLRFAHEMNNPMYPWSSSGGNSPEEYTLAWKYIHDRFEMHGVQNVSWVWNPWALEDMEDYFPYGENQSITQYVDWIGLTALNYGKASEDGKQRTFREIYEPFKSQIDSLSLNLPIMLAEYGSTSYGLDPAEWNNESISNIKNDYPEINAIVYFYSNHDKNWITNWRPDAGGLYVDWTFDLSKITVSLNTLGKPLAKGLHSNQRIAPITKTPSITGSFGNFQWLVNGEPFYLKGVCYNPGHDWREGFYPLTRKQLEHDFEQIKAMGANTIRRYEPSIYDYNIFNIAAEQDLKIMYGFWFDPAIDYYHDDKAVREYEKSVLDYVQKYKDQKTIIAWNIGNETWGLLKKYYSKPHLNLVRRAYLEFLEGLAQKIHLIDPNRPVFSSEEHDTYRLLAAVQDFQKHAPSIDVLGVNSYYEQNIQALQSVFNEYDTLRPYALTEFGPKGYWSKEFGDYRNGNLLIELSSLSKGNWYEKQWKEYIAFNQGYNLGGIAYSWRDRYEGTATWFGITDMKGRLKPAYYNLQNTWKEDHSLPYHFPEIHIVGHWYAINPGETLWLTAATVNDYKGELKYEWEVYEDESWGKCMELVQSRLNGQYIELRMPMKKSNYRVYVHATDSVGNVITASRPLLYN